MALSTKTIVLGLIILICLVFLYLVRAILTPFILAAVFAYILSPIVIFLEKRLRLPKNLAVAAVFLTVVSIIGIVSTEAGIRLAKETREFDFEAKYFNLVELERLPSWLRPSLENTLKSFNPAEIFRPERLWPYFSEALSGLSSIFIFLISAFYFLKDGGKLIDKLSSFFPSIHKVDVAILLRKINSALNDYLRGQLYLIIFMGFVTWFVLSILGVRYAVMLGILTGLAEIVPVIGPLMAGTIAVLVAMFDGVEMFGFTPLVQGLVVVLVYFILARVEDIFVVPFVIGRATKLHPLIIIFAVLAGSHLWGILGMIFAVPVAAIVRVSAEYLLEKIA